MNLLFSLNALLYLFVLDHIRIFRLQWHDVIMYEDSEACLNDFFSHVSWNARLMIHKRHDPNK